MIGEQEILIEAAAKVQETLGGNKKRRAEDTFEEEAEEAMKKAKN